MRRALSAARASRPVRRVTDLVRPAADPHAVRIGHDQVRGAVGRPPVPDHERLKQRQFRCDDDLWSRAQAAADDEGTDLSEWIRDAMEARLEGR
jgi:hypothetical protein